MPANSNTGKKRKLNDMSSTSSDQDPSAILRTLSTSLPPSTFIKLLEKDLYPVLSALPTSSRAIISNTLTEVKRQSDATLRKLSAIGYDAHQKSLEDAVKALNKSVKRDWADGWEEQSEMMGKISREVQEWLPTLWCTGVEDGLELPLIRKCLVLCTEIINKVENCNSRSAFGDRDFQVTITDSSDATIYKETSAYIGHTLAWMWREIVVTASAQGATTKDIESDIRRLNFKDRVYEFIRRDGQDKHHTGYNFWDAHWTTAMKDAASRLLTSQHAACIASFEMSPTFQLYTKLVNDSPNLRATLLQSTRSAISSSHPTITYGAAAAIFDASSQTDDLVRLLKSLPQYSQDSTVPRAAETIIRHLSKQSSPTHHETALDAIALGLNRVKEDILDEVSQAFPGFDEACDWLEEQIGDGKLTHKAPWGEKNYHTMTPSERKLDAKRDKYLDRFVERAAQGSDEYGYEGTVDDFRDPMDGVDSDDSDYEQQENARCPDLEKAVTKWVALLQEWPDKKEAAKLWDQVKECDADGSLLFAVDGLADNLASRCDWGYNHSGAKQYVADGLRAVYKTFSCPNLTALDKYTPKITTTGMISITSVPNFD